jgi:hypothetical protein
LRIGKNYVEYDVPPTGIDYMKEGYPEYQWPTYQNYIHIDFNSPEWSAFKNKKVVIMQNAFNTAQIHENHGGTYEDRFGLLENGKVTYGGEIRGLYDLSEKETLNLYTFLRLQRYEGSSEVFRTYFLIPEDVSEEPSDIIGYPHVFKITPLDSTKRCEIRISAIPKGYFEELVSDILQGRPRYTGSGEKENGKNVGKPIWIKDISINAEDNNKMDVVLTFTKGVKEEFILNSYWRNYADPDTVFGKISIGAGDDGWGIDEIDCKNSDIHNVSLGGSNPIFHSIQFSIPEGESYTLTINSTSNNVRLLTYTNRGQGSDGIHESKTINLESNESGHVTLYTMGQEATLSYQLTKN